jgi:hypothetical protein
MPTPRGITQDAVRAIALALPGVTKGAHHGHADFRVDGVFFLGFNPDGKWVNLRAAAANIDAMVRADPLTYRDVWKGRCVGVDVTRVDRKAMRTLVADARAFVASLKARTKRRTARKASS